MSLRWQEIVLIPEGEEDVPCECCGLPAARVEGRLLHQEAHLARYAVRWRPGDPQHLARHTLYLGDWTGRDGARGERRAVAVAEFRGGPDGGFSLRDDAERLAQGRRSRDLDDVIDRINAGPRPLAIYPFSHRRDRVDRLIERVMSGGVSVNDALIHVGQDDLPFGGVGESGMGHYHGREGFETFSKLRPVFHRVEPRIRAHVLLCWLALLLIRVAERRTGLTWRRIENELSRLHAVTLTGSAGTVVQTTPLTDTQATILRACELAPPPRVTTLHPA